MTTRFERIVSELDKSAVPHPDTREGLEDLARRIIAIADSRVLWTPAECSTYIGREQPVWANWQKRRSHDVPEPVFRTSSGAMYDADDVREWASRLECLQYLGDGSKAVEDWRVANFGKR